MKLIYLSLSALIAFGLIACGGDDDKNGIPPQNICNQLRQDNNFTNNGSNNNTNRYRDAQNEEYIRENNNVFRNIRTNESITCSNVNTATNNNYCSDLIVNNGSWQNGQNTFYNNNNNGCIVNANGTRTCTNTYSGQTGNFNPYANYDQSGIRTTTYQNGRYYQDGSLNNCTNFTHNCQVGIDNFCADGDGSTLNTTINGRAYTIRRYYVPAYYYGGQQYGGGWFANFQLSFGAGYY